MLAGVDSGPLQALEISGPLVLSGSLEEWSLGASLGRWGFMVALFWGIFHFISHPSQPHIPRVSEDLDGVIVTRPASGSEPQ